MTQWGRGGTRKGVGGEGRGERLGGGLGCTVGGREAQVWETDGQKWGRAQWREAAASRSNDACTPGKHV